MALIFNRKPSDVEQALRNTKTVTPDRVSAPNATGSRVPNKMVFSSAARGVYKDMRQLQDRVDAIIKKTSRHNKP